VRRLTREGLQHVEKDAFEDETPYGRKPFTNLVFTHDPSAPRRLVLSAHLDSKYFDTHPEDQFVGATDSAAPCAMMLDLATALTPWLDARRERVRDAGGEEGLDGQGETLQVVFFDGEEAFKEWTHTDSIYGARHLVEKWSETDSSPSAIRSTPRSPLRRISHLVLLDLLGAPNPLIRNFFQNTGWLFDEFLHSEERLGVAGYLWSGFEGEAYTEQKGKLGVRERSFFVPRASGQMQGWAGQIEDDHVPFVQQGVPVVHLISVPFPSVWHTIKVRWRLPSFPSFTTYNPFFAGRRVRPRLADHQGLGAHPPPDDSRVPWAGPVGTAAERQRQAE
jgi:hypothetical protein